MADGDQTFYNVRSATSPTHSIENELHACSGAIGGVAIRQRTADPDAQRLLADIAYLLTVLASRSSMPNKTTDAQRVELLAGAATVGSISTVAGVTTLNNQTLAGGYAMGPGQISLLNAQAAALRARITYTP